MHRLAEHVGMFVLCGPPGSGKTMTLFSALRALPGNFKKLLATFNNF